MDQLPGYRFPVTSIFIFVLFTDFRNPDMLACPVTGIPETGKKQKTLPARRSRVTHMKFLRKLLLEKAMAETMQVLTK
ncbi:hypothetical protein A4R26_08910 [Niastella populi]|uniref:Uncharacterized protein n=1 Tax=Niastella populi TaxID=550983 RepID=A0A1V9EIA1_9BACT|nr:hypothetical protein A4R26_08910 [Niastella populi]